MITQIYKKTILNGDIQTYFFDFVIKVMKKSNLL